MLPAWPNPAQLPCGVMNLPALGAPLNIEASRALSVGPPTHCSLEARVYHPGSALGRAGSTAQRGGEGPQGLGDFLPLDPILFHLLHSCQAEEWTVHQFQASPGLGTGATWSGVGSSPPSPIALPPLLASNTADTAHGWPTVNTQ